MSTLTSSVCLSRLSLQRSHHVTSSSRLSAQNVSPDSGHREMSSDSLSVGEATTTSTTQPQTTTTMTTRNNPLAPLGTQQGTTSDLLRRPSAAHSIGTTVAQSDPATTGHHGNARSFYSLGRDVSGPGQLFAGPRSSVDASTSVLSMSRFSRHVTTNQPTVGSLGNSLFGKNPDVEGCSDRRAVADGVVAGGNVEVVVNSNGWNRMSALSLHSSQNSFGELRAPPGHVMTVDSLPRVNSSN